MKRVLALLLIIAMCFSLTACGEGAKAQKREELLQGKRVLFVGCSYTYYGGTVCPAGTSNSGANNEDFLRENRDHDNGFFYQLCQSYGLDVNVTDWTFGGHTLKKILGNEICTHTMACKSKNPNGHLETLGDCSFDYVILNEIDRQDDSAEEIANSVAEYANIFKEANPDVKIYYIVHDGVYISDYGQEWLNSVEMIEDLGITILDWGTLVYDVATGAVKVPGATMDYRKNTFMVSRQNDSYHPNILSGYLYALMAYCAITGESAVGKPYDFCYDPAHPAYPISPRYEIDSYIRNCYKIDNPSTEMDERDTNFDDVFSSPEDMKGLQKLVDTYLKDKTDAWKNYIQS